MKDFTLKSVLLIAIFGGTAAAQLATWGDYVPRRSKPPVVFVTGHDGLCPDPRSGEIPFFQLTFGNFDKVMARDGRVSFVFEACYAPDRPPIEEIANLLRRLISSLTYEDGEPVSELDIVAHSMGGLVTRAYLAGKQIDGTFSPPTSPRVRKIVFIGTPHFGTAAATLTDVDPQVREMSCASPFLFDLATWNQGREDLRGIEALSIIGTAGQNGIATDSVVTVTSAALDFVIRSRTIVLPYCHTQGGIGQLFLCNAAPGLARVQNEDHPTARLVLGFLNDTESWRGSVDTAGANPVLAGTTGLLVRSRTANDEPLAIHSATVVHDSGVVSRLEVNSAGIAYGEMLRAGPSRLTVDGVTRRITLTAGGSRALVIKHGPFIDAVEPAARPSWPLLLAPGMLVSIKGTELNAAARQLYLAGKPVRVLSATDDYLLAVLPEATTGIGELTVRNSTGQHTVRVLLEAAFPVLYTRDGFAAAVHASSGEAVTHSAPASGGEVISLFLTGLGDTTPRDGLHVAIHQPVVTVADEVCELLFAGRSPVFAGVDQINCRMPQRLPAGVAKVRVKSGTRSNSADLALR